MKKKKNIMFLFIVLFIFIITSCSLSTPTETYENNLESLESSDIVEEIFTYIEDYPINDIGNTLHGGTFFADDNYIFGNQYAGESTPYFASGKINWQSDFAYVITDEDKIVENKAYLLQENPVKNICVFQDQVYYIDEIFPDWVNGFNFSKGRINVMNLDGTGSKQLTEESVRIFYIYNSYIYYLTIEGEFTEKYIYNEGVTPISKIYRMKLDGSEKSLIHEVEGNINRFSLSFGKIYYSYKEEFNIIEFDLKTKEKIDYSDFFDFSDIEDSFDKFPRESSNRSHKELFNSRTPYSIMRRDKYIYFLDFRFLFRIDIEKMELTNLNENFYDDRDYMHIVDEYILDDKWIYYVTSIGLFKCSIDKPETYVFMAPYENAEIGISNLQLVNDDIYFTRDRWNQIEKMPVDGDETQVVYIEYGG